ncbi:hypothetical protein CCHR01_11110 [Colletotrichum chrysophilum]|uniref:Uncharacterized protein n=1 Tax=Colletotrichum chrysophilum TaxID=1836956 RepID=A0AAD9EIQ9_9PEZI|nr:hypothetical protein CCHR01_11110 [Colletotrichum chrysophilum]
MKREPATGGRQDRTGHRHTRRDRHAHTHTHTKSLRLRLHSAAASHRLESLGAHVDTLAVQQEHGARCSVETDRRDRLLRLFGWKAVRDLARPGAKSTYFTYTSTDTGYIPPTESRPWGLEIGNGPRTTPRCYPFDIHCHRSGPECNGSIDAEIITLNCVTNPAIGRSRRHLARHYRHPPKRAMAMAASEATTFQRQQSPSPPTTCQCRSQSPCPFSRGRVIHPLVVLRLAGAFPAPTLSW